MESLRMNRVAILGCCGSGKSHVARTLSRLLGTAVTYLDAVYYDDEWNPLPPEEFEAAQRELVSAPRWIIDGNYNSTLEIRLRACDTVVLMDVPTRAAMWGIVSRHLRYGRGQHPRGIYNRLHWGLISYVAAYRRRMRPKVLAKIERFAPGANVVLLTGRAATRRWLEQVAADR